MREILPGILTWPWFSERQGYDFNGYLFRLPGGNLCVDPVEMQEEVLGEIAEAGVARIVLTNRNHFRAAAALQARTSARVAVHPADAAFVRAQGVAVDDELLPGGRFAGFEVVDASGKSPGEVALWNPARRILLVGDACVGKPAGECALLHNWLLHSSDVNHTDIPRRAFSVCYMDAQTRWRGAPDRFSVIFQ